jgi:hypothetical protein
MYFLGMAFYIDTDWEHFSRGAQHDAVYVDTVL